jgi:SAM-dependent methyltransferase
MSLFPAAGEGRRVLDVGCAEGYLSRLLADRSFEVVGMDRPGPKPQAFPPQARLVQANLDCGLPPGLGTFDYVLCADILEHLRDPRRFMTDLLACFSEGGRLIASLPNSGNLYFRLNTLFGRFPQHERGLFDKTHLHFLTWKGWQDLFAQTGFRIEQVLPTGVPVGMAFPRWQDSWTMQALEEIAYAFARHWMTLFAYQFVVVARPEARL